MLAHKIHRQGLVGLGGKLDALVDQSHLIDEQVAENTRAIHHHINTRTTEFLQGNQFELINAAQGISHGAHADKPEDLS